MSASMDIARESILQDMSRIIETHIQFDEIRAYIMAYSLPYILEGNIFDLFPMNIPDEDILDALDLAVSAHGLSAEITPDECFLFLD